jgi:hypothetical protein
MNDHSFCVKSKNFPLQIKRSSQRKKGRVLVGPPLGTLVSRGALRTQGRRERFIDALQPDELELLASLGGYVLEVALVALG